MHIKLSATRKYLGCSAKVQWWVSLSILYLKWWQSLFDRLLLSKAFSYYDSFSLLRQCVKNMQQIKGENALMQLITCSGLFSRPTLSRLHIQKSTRQRCKTSIQRLPGINQHFNTTRRQCFHPRYKLFTQRGWAWADAIWRSAALIWCHQQAPKGYDLFVRGSLQTWL